MNILDELMAFDIKYAVADAHVLHSPILLMFDIRNFGGNICRDFDKYRYLLFKYSEILSKFTLNILNKLMAFDKKYIFWLMRTSYIRSYR